ncbi:hypothetical protein [Deinococcus radiodurans]|uniref:hypothetical protein n=1 Tax=Deinococcus radiodurans TaxID=1299 RepID=UPI0002D39B85|nr:hypothetical protein [Deinococcus radiodurans]ANC71940.1 hypothetical protein A2G07_09265 [Deinococcus radiodurans R1 = ATCC 13939 = DSM 20539]QIP28971.1 hypothetical protein HAV23_07165 [Deinococcus radiodurans]QIP32320.1 hypothetical protein HAV35_09625 [Deinococcus radiodurans]UID69846.1 hypothetical protein DRO_0845 [Deinococcus radiodurans R1 = ATCC 13939 = DSM 20539]
MTQDRTLETSEAEFAHRYAAYAAEGELYPQTEGSPLLEFLSGGRVLYLFDRCGPYAARPGPARVVVHGLLDLSETEVLGPDAGDAGESLTVQGVSAVTGRGQIVQASRRVWVVQARLPLVLADFGPLPSAQPGDWVAFRTLPPLHGFVVKPAGSGFSPAQPLSSGT